LDKTGPLRRKPGSMYDVLIEGESDYEKRPDVLYEHQPADRAMLAGFVPWFLRHNWGKIGWYFFRTTL
jgi:hypothetical protein